MHFSFLLLLVFPVSPLRLAIPLMLNEMNSLTAIRGGNFVNLSQLTSITNEGIVVQILMQTTNESFAYIIQPNKPHTIIAVINVTIPDKIYI